MSKSIVQPNRIPVPKVLDTDTIRGFRQAVLQAIKTEAPEILLDCKSLCRVSSEHVGVIWRAVSDCRARSIDTKLVSVSDTLLRVLRILDLDKMVEIEMSRSSDEAGSRSVENESQFDHTSKLLRLTSSPSVESIEEASAKLRGFLASIDLAAQESIELETVFYEVVMNISNYSQLGAEDQFEVIIEFSEQQITFIFTDNGVAFDPTNPLTAYAPEEAILAGRKNGYGLTMISRMTDTREYRRSEDGRNILTLTKRIRGGYGRG